MRGWLTSRAHSHWLEAEGDRLLEFGRAARHPAGGFAGGPLPAVRCEGEQTVKGGDRPCGPQRQTRPLAGCPKARCRALAPSGTEKEVIRQRGRRTAPRFRCHLSVQQFRWTSSSPERGGCPARRGQA